MTEMKYFGTSQSMLSELEAPCHPLVQLKMGVSIGGCHGGLIGSDSGHLSYELWGKITEEVAIMRDTCPLGKIQCSKKVKKLVGHLYSFERGPSDSKKTTYLSNTIDTAYKI
jgi:hypothetical protein